MGFFLLGLFEAVIFSHMLGLFEVIFFDVFSIVEFFSDSLHQGLHSSRCRIKFSGTCEAFGNVWSGSPQCSSKLSSKLICFLVRHGSV